MERTLRAAKGIAICLLAAGFTLGLGWPRPLAVLWAQTAANNSMLAPVPPPAAPAQLPAPVTTAIAPVLAPMPSPPQSTPTPALRAFNCSCFGHGSGTSWMGRVTAPAYFDARQGAVGACLAYNERREPAPAGLTTYTSAGTSVPVLPGANIPGTAGQLAQQLPGALNFSTAAQLEACSNCVCN